MSDKILFFVMGSLHSHLYAFYVILTSRSLSIFKFARSTISNIVKAVNEASFLEPEPASAHSSHIIASVSVWLGCNSFSGGRQ